MECSICKKNKDLSLGSCFDCADAESIIAEGLDMWDKGIDGKEDQAKTSMDKLKLLTQKGWKYSPKPQPIKPQPTKPSEIDSWLIFLAGLLTGLQIGYYFL